jgi:hypothetical protein
MVLVQPHILGRELVKHVDKLVSEPLAEVSDLFTDSGWLHICVSLKFIHT